jgi:glycosyltransferase involved in cell wall biosynthesis
MIYYSIDEMFASGPPPEFPVIIPTFNNPSYLARMINQLQEYGLNDIIVVDNFSSYPVMQEYLNIIGQSYTVVKKFTNDGPTEFYRNPQFLAWLPEYFIITDPDIGFNPNLPKDFVQTLKDVSVKHNMMRVGFALDIEMEGVDHNMHDIMFHTTGLTMHQWEARFWHNQIGSTDNGDPIFAAPIDTTFCLINKNNDTGDYYEPSVRIGGNFTAQHYGWYNNPPLPESEFEYYLNNIPGHWSETGNAIKRKRNQ